MEILTNPNALSLREAVNTIEAMKERIGKTVYFKANKGSVKLMCE